MGKVKDKTAQICALYFIEVDEAEIEDYPGMPYIFVSGIWSKIRFSKVEFKEEQILNGDMINQNFNATISGLNIDEEKKLIDICGKLVLLRIDFTNGDIKVVGTNRAPVSFSLSRSGTPTVLNLSFKRSSPEFSKFFKSF